MKTTMSRPKWAMWPLWVLAVGSGEALGFGLPLYVLSFPRLPSGTPEYVLFAVLVMVQAFHFGLIGLAQWLVLRPYARDVSRLKWVLATIVGGFAAWFVGLSVPLHIAACEGCDTYSITWGALAIPSNIFHWSDIWQAAVLGVVVGVMLGLTQWFVLRTALPRSYWWVVANCAGWGFGLVLVVSLIHSAALGSYDQFFRDVFDRTPEDFILSWLVTGGSGVFVLGSFIVGLALVGLLRQDKQVVELDQA